MLSSKVIARKLSTTQRRERVKWYGYEGHAKLMGHAAALQLMQQRTSQSRRLRLRLPLSKGGSCGQEQVRT